MWSCAEPFQHIGQHILFLLHRAVHLTKTWVRTFFERCSELVGIAKRMIENDRERYKGKDQEDKNRKTLVGAKMMKFP